jgi:hypothetical protein
MQIAQHMVYAHFSAKDILYFCPVHRRNLTLVAELFAAFDKAKFVNKIVDDGTKDNVFLPTIVVLWIRKLGSTTVVF